MRHGALIAAVLLALSACRASSSSVSREKSGSKETQTTRLPGRSESTREIIPGTGLEGKGDAPFDVEVEEEPAPVLTKEERAAREAERKKRRKEILKAVGEHEDPFAELLRTDGYSGPLMASSAVEAFAQGRNLAAVLFAQAAVGADPGNGSRRRLLSAISKATDIPADPEGLLPLEALVHLELKRADSAFFNERFGDAIQRSRRVLLLDDSKTGAWLRLGSAHYALGERKRARRAYGKASLLDPKDKTLTRFMAERGWNGK
ncbi:MAG: hypothetical protein V3S11_02405 [Elusimicrobiota bacterium]